MSQSQRSVLRSLGSQVPPRATRSTAAAGASLGQKRKDPPASSSPIRCTGVASAVEKSPGSAQSNASKGKGVAASSMEKRPRTEVVIPEDVAVFIKKMMTFLTPELREEARGADMTGQLDECAGSALKVSLLCQLPLCE